MKIIFLKCSRNCFNKDQIGYIDIFRNPQVWPAKVAQLIVKHQVTQCGGSLRVPIEEDTRGEERYGSRSGDRRLGS